MAHNPPLIDLIAGEPSGDMLGASLMSGLSARLNGRVRFAGIGGEAMRAQGFSSLFPMSDLSVMGLAEVLPRIPHILRRANQTLDDIKTQAPLAVITIDSWGFCGRIQKRLKAELPQIHRLHYVAPMVWAWKSGRTKTLAKVLDMLMTLLPFEPPWFEKEGLKTVCVGHSVIESGAGQGDAAAFRLRHGIGADSPILTVLPGSRTTETARLLPVFERVALQLATQIPQLNVVIPTVEGVADQVHRAVAASGTVTLELAMARLPMVVAYRVSPLSAFIATRFLGLRVKFASLLNILSDRMVVPEFLQKDCQPDKIAASLLPLFSDSQARRDQLSGLVRTVELLGGDQSRPSLRAADAVLQQLELQP